MSSTSKKSRTLDAGSTMGGFDGISSLPDEAAHHLLGFLDVGDLSQMMLVSKRWNRLCMSIPVLTVDNRDQTPDSRYNLLIQNFLALRCKAGTEVLRFNFTWQFSVEAKTTRRKQKNYIPLQNEFQRVHGYYWNVINSCGVECLCLSFMSREAQGLAVSLPYDIAYAYKNLKELTIFCANDITVWVPNSLVRPTISKLETLTLQSCGLKDSHLHALGTTLRSLKVLNLINCTGLKSLNVSCLSLENLQISYDEVVELECVAIMCARLTSLLVRFYPSPGSEPLFSITSCKLQYFAWFGFPLGTFIPAERFNCHTPFHLEIAVFYLLLPSRTRASWDISKVSKGTLLLVIAQLKMTKFLRLHSNTVEVIHKLFIMKGWSRLPLGNVQRVAIDCCYLNDKEVPAISFFLQGLLELESLSITASVASELLENIPPSHMKGMKGFDVDYWEAQDLKFVTQLKKATIDVWCGGNGVELVKYILKHATALETLNILCDKALESSVSQQVMGYKSQSTSVLFSSRPKRQKNLEDLFKDIC